MSQHLDAIGMDAALSDLRVVEWGRGIAAAYAGRLLASFGARVTRIDEPGQEGAGRDATRETAAFFDDRKERAVMDLGAPEGRDAFAALLRGADVFLHDATRHDLVRSSLNSSAIRGANPRLLEIAVTPFGSSGPYRDFRARDLEIAFLSGLAYLTPRDIPAANVEASPPLKMPGSLVSIYAGASAAAAALTALRSRDRGSGGDFVDVSMLESLIPTLRREIALFQYEGRVATRFMRVWRLAPWGVKRCLDGHVFLQVVEKHHWEGLVEMMESPDWALDPRYLDPDFRFEHRADIESRMQPWLLTQAKSRFAWEAQRRSLPFAPVNQVGDLLRIPQLHFRQFFRTARAADGGPCLVPATPFHFSPDAGDASSAPAQRRPSEPVAPPPERDAREAPLAGLRVIDFGHVWAGPYCAALLADMGAEVIKVESAQRLDVHRRQGPYAERRAGINRSGVWNAQNRGKRSVTLNLSTERGRDLARSLVGLSDVVIENFAPGVMQRLGLDYGTLSSARPGLVMASLSAFGQEGPQKGYVGYGPSLDAWAGLDALTAYPGGEPNALGGVFPDTGSAIHAAAAILAALHRRERTGAGCYIDLSELEVSILLIGDRTARDLAGDSVGANGNRDGAYSPQGAYRCAGEDAWIALTVVDETSWLGLCGLLGRSDWAGDPLLRSAAGRDARTAEIDSAIGGWTRTRAPLDAMLELQAQGVPSGAAHDARSLLSDPHLVARDYFGMLTHPEVGAHPVYAPIWRFERASTSFGSAAPMLGADNDYVLRTLLELSSTEINALVTQRAVY